eukprot:1003401-Prymnesium_polylepis.1
MSTGADSTHVRRQLPTIISTASTFAYARFVTSRRARSEIANEHPQLSLGREAENLSCLGRDAENFSSFSCIDM